MLIRIASDIHTECKRYGFINLPEDKDSVLVLAGDVGVVNSRGYNDRLQFLLEECSNQFRAVVMVFGNHEYYQRGDLRYMHDVVRKWIHNAGCDNVHILENSHVIIDDVAFIGATLWTDYENNQTLMWRSTRYMADYHQILFDDMRFIMPEDILEIHKESRKYIFEQAKQCAAQGYKTVIVTHHGVTKKSTHEKYRYDSNNHNFVSDLTEEIVDANPNLMIHGHVHDPFDYMVDPDRCQTRVVVNPRGYVPYEDHGYDESCQVEI